MPIDHRQGSWLQVLYQRERGTEPTEDKDGIALNDSTNIETNEPKALEAISKCENRE